MAVADPKVQKGFRTTDDTRRLIEVLAVLENKDQGDLLTDMVNTYLVANSNSYARFFAEAAALAQAAPDSVGASTATLRDALLHAPQLSFAPQPSARERIAARQASSR